jgi:hypothetical protein
VPAAKFSRGSTPLRGLSGITRRAQQDPNGGGMPLSRPEFSKQNQLVKKFDSDCIPQIWNGWAVLQRICAGVIIQLKDK